MSMRSSKQNKDSRENSLRNLWLLLHRTHNVLSRTSEAAFNGIGVKPQHVAVLTALDNLEGPVTMSKVAGFLERDVNAITMTVNRMEKAGLVERSRDLPDRRAVRLEATEKGKKVYSQAWKIRQELISNAWFDLSDDDLEEAARCIGIIKQLTQRELSSRKKKTLRSTT